MERVRREMITNATYRVGRAVSDDGRALVVLNLCYEGQDVVIALPPAEAARMAKDLIDNARAIRDGKEN